MFIPKPKIKAHGSVLPAIGKVVKVLIDGKEFLGYRLKDSRAGREDWTWHVKHPSRVSYAPGEITKWRHLKDEDSFY